MGNLNVSIKELLTRPKEEIVEFFSLCGCESYNDFPFRWLGCKPLNLKSNIFKKGQNLYIQEISKENLVYAYTFISEEEIENLIDRKCNYFVGSLYVRYAHETLREVVLITRDGGKTKTEYLYEAT